MDGARGIARAQREFSERQVTKMNRLLMLSLVMSAACTDDFGTNVQALTGDNGTSLSVSIDETSYACDEDGASAAVSVDFTVTSTAAANSAELTASVDGGAELSIGSVDSDTWTVDGRTKTAGGSATFSLSEGTHTIVICATQSGANGRLSKHACSVAAVVEVECNDKQHCNQGIGNGAEGCDPGNSNHHNPSNDELGDGRGKGN
jgi:hypothetical protein